MKGGSSSVGNDLICKHKVSFRKKKGAPVPGAPVAPMPMIIYVATSFN